MRYGLADVRNYDSVELARSLAWFAPLYEPERVGADEPARRSPGPACSAPRPAPRGRRAARSSRPTPPPPGAFDRVDRVGAVWVARLDAAPLGRGRDRARTRSTSWSATTAGSGFASICARDDRIIVRETFDPGWRAEVDGRARRGRAVSRRVSGRAGRRRARIELVLRYDPPEVRLGRWRSRLSRWRSRFSP